MLGNGSIVASNGDPASFRVNVHVHKDRSRGRVSYADDGPADSLVVRSRAVEHHLLGRERKHLRGRTAPAPVCSGSTSDSPTPTGSAPRMGTTPASGR